MPQRRSSSSPNLDQADLSVRSIIPEEPRAGSAVELPAGLEADDLVSLYRDMVLMRAFDERMVALQRQGRLGNYPMCWGEEGAQVGSLRATRDTDWVFPTYRQQLIPILRGVDPATILRYRAGIGGTAGFWSPKQHHVAPITISIATHLPHAVGLAHAAKLKGDDTASLAWFGDGATSEGDFHEAMNFAAVFGVATVFFCTNNQWAISTPITRQMATEGVAEKAIAYGMPAVRVDGFDVVACWAATRAALERGRAGGGPTLIEAVTYRIGPHATADDPGRYRDQAEAERWRAKDPVARLARYLKAVEAIGEAEIEQIARDAQERVAAAVSALDGSERPSSDVLFETTYAGPMPPGLVADRDLLRSEKT